MTTWNYIDDDNLPPIKTLVLVAVEFDCVDDWRIKVGSFVPDHPDACGGWIIPEASWTPSHWMQLPEPPEPSK
jgi:hypothetical protein